MTNKLKCKYHNGKIPKNNLNQKYQKPVLIFWLIYGSMLVKKLTNKLPTEASKNLFFEEAIIYMWVCFKYIKIFTVGL